MWVQLIAAVAVGVLKYLSTRASWIEEGQAREWRAALSHANAALQWRVDHATPRGADADLRRHLRVRKPGDKVTRLPGDDPGPPIVPP